ncbi:hypothetical protein G6F62_014538 [Rhizopus arrhizus]|nr:hypothetical protein G6F62_014538 [Rhizopus arrhizus]
MPRPSPHGWVYGVPREPDRPGQLWDSCTRPTTRGLAVRRPTPRPHARSARCADSACARVPRRSAAGACCGTPRTRRAAAAARTASPARTRRGGCAGRPAVPRFPRLRPPPTVPAPWPCR